MFAIVDIAGFQEKAEKGVKMRVPTLSAKVGENVVFDKVLLLSKEEGGRHTPFFSGYKPQFYIRTTDVTGEVTLPEGTEMVMPGDNVTITVELIAPIAMEKELRFAIREGGRTVGAGVVTEVIQ